MKVCNNCNIEKDYTAFYKHKTTGDGYRTSCSACLNKEVSELPPEKRAEWSRKSYLKRKTEDPAYFMWRQAKHRAKWDYNDMAFTIDVSDLIIPDTCPYLGITFEPLSKTSGYSLDRIDNTKGYIKGNVQVISRLANIMKNNATEEQLVAFAKGVLAAHTKEGRRDAVTSN